MDLRPVGVALPNGSRSKGTARIVGVAIVLLICSGGYIYCSCGDWPFDLTVTVESEEGKKYRYTPKSYFHLSVDGLVHLIVEVQSERDEKDRYRMLLQGACAARAGRKIYKRSSLVMALYIKNNGIVERYLLFQEGDDTKVCTFQSKQSCIFSLILVGFLCPRHAILDDETVRPF